MPVQSRPSWIRHLACALALGVTTAFSSAQAAPVDDASPMASFERLMDGAWHLGVANGSVQRDTWRWGAGRHAIVGRTINSKADGESTSGLVRVLYWHPGNERIEVFTLSSGGLVGEGVVNLRDDANEYVTKLHYGRSAEARRYVPTGIRALTYEMRFDGDDTYRMVWTRDGDSDDPRLMPEWVYRRVDAATPFEQAEPRPQEPLDHLERFGPVLDRTWTSETTDRSVSTHTVFSRIPHLDAIHMTVDEVPADRDPTRVVDAWIHFHPRTEALHVLRVEGSGTVEQGRVRFERDGTILFETTRHDGETTSSLERRFVIESDDVLRERVRIERDDAWILESDRSHGDRD